MKNTIIRKAKVESLTVGEGPYLRVQAVSVGPMEPGAGIAQIYFSTVAAQAPKPGQLIEFMIEWEAPGA